MIIGVRLVIVKLTRYSSETTENYQWINKLYTFKKIHILEKCNSRSDMENH